jgi:hypothetical protein
MRDEKEATYTDNRICNYVPSEWFRKKALSRGWRVSLKKLKIFTCFI